MSVHPCLEIEFTPTKDGSDKHIKVSTALPTIDHIKSLIQQHFKKKKILLSNLFSVGQDTVDIKLAFPSDADSIIKSKSILIPSISSYHITIHPSRHLSIQKALELIITGLSRF
uniref:Uncharacterized protein n=1 Tax=Moniliophthora roreri TaxID=221103 RepID=A0A0W0FDV3_MONRR